MLPQQNYAAQKELRGFLDRHGLAAGEASADPQYQRLRANVEQETIINQQECDAALGRELRGELRHRLVRALQSALAQGPTLARGHWWQQHERMQRTGAASWPEL